MNSFNDVINNYFIEECGLEASQFGAETSLFVSGLLDSIDVIGLISFLERRFKFKVNAFDLSLEDLDTVAKISNFVAHKLNTVTC